MATYGVLSTHVVSELIDGEAVILDLRNGRYYTTDGVGAEVWRAASDGIHRDDIVASCCARFPGQPAVAEDVDELLAKFVAAELLMPQDGLTAKPAELVWPDVYRKPVLDAYDNLADMMALDPIHDVDAVGWPAPGALADSW